MDYSRYSLLLYVNKFPIKLGNSIQQGLFGISPFETDDDIGGAQEPLNYVIFVLLIFGKYFSNVASFIGDNFPTNKDFVHFSKSVFIGCSSHRYNLAGDEILVKYESVLSQGRELMRKL